MVDVGGNISSVVAEGRWGGLLLRGGVCVPQEKFSKWWPCPCRALWQTHRFARLSGLVWRLRFLAAALFSNYADLRVSLRKMRKGQRNSHSFQRLERHEVPAVRFYEIGEEIFDLRLSERGQHRGRAGQEGRRWMRRRVRVPSLTAHKTFQPRMDTDSEKLTKANEDNGGGTTGYSGNAADI